MVAHANGRQPASINQFSALCDLGPQALNYELASLTFDNKAEPEHARTTRLQGLLLDEVPVCLATEQLLQQSPQFGQARLIMTFKHSLQTLNHVNSNAKRLALSA